MEATKIFRPWDNLRKKSDRRHQDSTISTTTDSEIKEIIVPLKPPKDCDKLKCDFTDIPSVLTPEASPIQLEKVSNFYYPTQCLSSSSYGSYPLMGSHFLNQSQVQLPETGLLDHSFMDVFPEYAMKEYARVISQEQQAKLINSRKQRPKKHICPHCQVGFSNNGQLKGHIRIHTGERPFRCDHSDCGKTFTRNEELTRHKRIHTGMRPFKCDICQKRFGRKDHLKKHTRTHTQALQQKGLQLVPVVLPASAWASIPPSAGMPMYNHHVGMQTLQTQLHCQQNLFPSHHYMGSIPSMM